MCVRCGAAAIATAACCLAALHEPKCHHLALRLIPPDIPCSRQLGGCFFFIVDRVNARSIVICRLTPTPNQYGWFQLGFTAQVLVGVVVFALPGTDPATKKFLHGWHGAVGITLMVLRCAVSRQPFRQTNHAHHVASIVFASFGPLEYSRVLYSTHTRNALDGNGPVRA